PPPMVFGSHGDPGLALQWLAQHIPNVQEQYTLVTTTQVLQMIRQHPMAVRNADLLALDHRLFEPGGALYATTWEDWSPYHALDLQPATLTAWAHAVYPNNICPAPPYIYEGGGFIKGPDGREYPLVVPTVMQNGKTYTGNAPSLAYLNLDEL